MCLDDMGRKVFVRLNMNKAFIEAWQPAAKDIGICPCPVAITSLLLFR